MSKQDVLGHGDEQLLASFRDAARGAQRLKGISLFARLTDDELRKIYAFGKLLHLRPKSAAVVEGEPTRGMYILLKGRVSVHKNDPTTGSLVRLALLDEGANFGEISLFDSAPRSATVTAETDCYLFELAAEDFNRFLEMSGSEVQTRFFKTCAEELAARFRTLNGDYINSQRLLWKYALRREGQGASNVARASAAPPLAKSS